MKELSNINCAVASLLLLLMMHKEITFSHRVKRYRKGSKTTEYEFYYVLYEDLLICLNTKLSKATFLFSKTDEAKVEALVQRLKKFMKIKN
jgi:hypothetical protein